MIYVVVDSCLPDWQKTFKNKKSCEEWLLDGILTCEGAERDHYVEMLREYRSGKRVLHYN